MAVGRETTAKHGLMPFPGGGVRRRNLLDGELNVGNLGQVGGDVCDRGQNELVETPLWGAPGRQPRGEKHPAQPTPVAVADRVAGVVVGGHGDSLAPGRPASLSAGGASGRRLEM